MLHRLTGRRSAHTLGSGKCLSPIHFSGILDRVTLAATQPMTWRMLIPKPLAVLAESEMIWLATCLEFGETKRSMNVLLADRGLRR